MFCYICLVYCLITVAFCHPRRKKQGKRICDETNEKNTFLFRSCLDQFMILYVVKPDLEKTNSMNSAEFNVLKDFPPNF